jgi:HPt (histidine-containing phosphotransfer) domain-containing protein
MTAPHIIAARQNQDLSELTSILERHDPEAAARLAKTNHGGGVPTSPKKPLENATYLAESLLILAQIVDERLTPKKRGQPRQTAH